MSSKRAEALAHCAAAEKALTTSFFKRKPVYDTAVSEYELAATAFRYAQAYDEAVQTFVKLADAHKQCESPYMAAKAMESAGQLCAQQLKRLEEGARYYARAAELFQLNNNLDRAVEQLEKAGKTLEAKSIDDALVYYLRACELYEDELRSGSKGMVAVDTFRKVLTLHLRQRQVDKAVAISARLTALLQGLRSAHLLERQHLVHVILLLEFGDYVEAAKQYQVYVGESPAFARSDEGEIAGMLLDGYEKRDIAVVAEALKRQQITFLDAEVVKVARNLRVGGMSVADFIKQQAASAGGGGAVAASITGSAASIHRQQQQQPAVDLCGDGPTPVQPPPADDDLC